MFQLIYLTFTAPRADPGGVRACMTAQMKAALANQTATPGVGVRRGARRGAQPESSAARSR